MLEFEFEENPYFSNQILTKTYYLSDVEDQLELIYDHTVGCEINWKEESNLSVLIEVKKQRHKSTQKTRTVKKSIPQETFFSFFDTIPIPKDEDEEVEEGLVIY